MMQQNNIAETAEYFEKLFAHGGQWEANNGREQTRNFAECFLKNTVIPFQDFSLLDVGCALGDAAPVFKKAYPEAKVFGCDVSGTAVGRCKKDYGNIAEFFKAGFQEIQGSWDVIYCSNVLEHFEEYKEIALRLLKKCRVLYIMAPYYELKKGRPLDPTVETVHKVTLYKDSFDYLYTQGMLASPVHTVVIRCPKAWSPPMLKEISREMTRALKMALLMRYFPPRMRQIIYTLRNKEQRPHE